jgi:hypothetical protein
VRVPLRYSRPPQGRRAALHRRQPEPPDQRAAPDVACVAALVIQAPGLIADRWLFFAQAKHPQNLYYQVVS